MPTPFPSSDHLSPTRAQGFRQTVACLCFWSFGKPLTPEQELLSARSPCERIAFRVCKAELWCRAWWERNRLTVRQIAAPFGYLFLFCLIASVVFMVMAIWPDGMAR